MPNPPFINILQSLTVGPRASEINMSFYIKILPPRDSVSHPFYGIYLLDVSGSMGEKNKIGAARDSLIQQVKTLPEGTIFTLITFGPVSVRVENQRIDHESRPSIIKTIEKLKVWGSTPLFEALERAFEILKKYQGELKTKKITVISDGNPDGGCSSTDINDPKFQRFLKFPDWSREFKVSIDTVGALYGHNVLLMYELARQSTGKYIFANTPEELKEKMTIASEQTTSVIYHQPIMVINSVISDCRIQDAVQIKPTIIRMPFEHVGDKWKLFFRSLEAGDTYQILFKMDYHIGNEYLSMNHPIELMNLEFDFGDPQIQISKPITIQFSDNPGEYKLNQQIAKLYVQSFSQAEEIRDSTVKGDAEHTQKVQGDETRKVKEK